MLHCLMNIRAGSLSFIWPAHVEDVPSMWSTFWIGEYIALHMVKQRITSHPLQMVGGQEGVFK